MLLNRCVAIFVLGFPVLALSQPCQEATKHFELTGEKIEVTALPAGVYEYSGSELLTVSNSNEGDVEALNVTETAEKDGFKNSVPCHSTEGRPINPRITARTPFKFLVMENGSLATDKLRAVFAQLSDTVPLVKGFTLDERQIYSKKDLEKEDAIWDATDTTMHKISPQEYVVVSVVDQELINVTSRIHLLYHYKYSKP